MRIYETFPIALNEIKRELKEMGQKVTTQSVQNIVEPIEMMELQDYIYTVTKPNWTEIPVKSREWCDEEFKERVSGAMINPGHAWKIRRQYWEKFLNKSGRFDYAYPERITMNLDHVINALKKDIHTRRAYLSILGLSDVPDSFNKRYPCSIGYRFNFRQDRLNMTYLLRSSDYFEHLAYDLHLAHRLQCYVANQVGVQSGHFCHYVGSLHCFLRDVKDVF
jgi:thymidylate synthase